MAEDEEADYSNNARLFRIAVSNVLRSVAGSVSENEFLEIFTILKSKPKIVQKLHKAMVKELYDSMNDDVEEIIKEGDLQENLTKLAKLSEESTKFDNKQAWRPPGDVKAHMRSLDAHKIKEVTEKLEKQVNEIERENKDLMKTIVESRSRIRATNDNVMRILNCAPVVMQQLENTCKELATSLERLENE
ncbi:hypothetical protein PUN28_010326 [Cardiocondyla obscurior]|uniref:Polyamine-modulated factor 1 n=1 Tax=Cardiocondyla obscurior TaxID=286306 RepID=A0AAW2FQL0_9HYME